MSCTAMNAEDIARALGGWKSGCAWMARCPAHHDRSPSLSVRDSNAGKVLVYCHAGCDQGRVLAALRSRGLWPNNECRPLSPKVRHRLPVEGEADPDDTSRTETALAIWRSAQPAQGTLVEFYLAL